MDQLLRKRAVLAWVIVAMVMGQIGSLTAVEIKTDLAQAKPDEVDSQKKADQPEPQKGILLQPGDAIAEPLKPLKPRTEADRMRIEALTWYSVGRMHQKNGQFQDALQAFENAHEKDPKSSAILNELIPLCLSLNRADDAITYAKQAIKIDPGNYVSLQLLGEYLLRQNKQAEAIKLFEEALATSDLDKQSKEYVLVQRTLGILYFSVQAFEKAAEAFAVVFEAMEAPEKYGLNSRLQQYLATHVITKYEQLGNIFSEGKRPALAIRAYKRALETKAGNAGNIGYSLAQAYFASDQPELALKELQEYFDAQRQFKGLEAYAFLATILKSLNKSDELIPRLEEMAEKDKRNSKLQIFFAERLIEAEDLDRAERVLNETVAKSADPEAFAMLSSIYRKQKRPRELLESLARGYKAGNSDRPIEEELQAIGASSELVESVIAESKSLKEDELNFPQLYVLAQLAMKVEKNEAAEEFFRTALKRTRLPEQKDDAYLELSELLRGQRKFDEAATVLQDAADDPSFIGDRGKRVFYHYLRAFNLELGGKTQPALDAIAKSMDLAGQPNGELKLREAWVYYHSSQYDEAIKHFDQIIKDFPDDARVVRLARSNLSNVYIQQGEMRKGEEVLEVILAEEPDDPGINNDLGYLYADQGKNLEQAEKMIRKALAAEPENAAYLDSMGWVLYKLKKYDEALPFLEKASGMKSGQDSTIFDHLGDVYESLDKIDKAVASWKKALELTKQDLKRNLKIIEQLKEKLKKHAPEADK